MTKNNQSPLRAHLPILFILLLLLVLRLVFTWENYQSPLFDSPRIDEQEYEQWSTEVEAGRFFLEVLPNHGAGYPWLLGVLYSIFGHDLIIPRLLNVLLGLGSAFMVYLIALRLFDRTSALVSAFLIGAYWPLLIFEQRILAESLFLFLVLFGLQLAVRGAQIGSSGSWAGSGLVLGLATIVRPTAIALFPFFFIWLVFQSLRRRDRGFIIAAVYFLACGAVIIGPYLYENQQRYREGWMVQMNAGMNLYLGNNPDADGTPYARPDGSWDRIESMPVHEAGLIKAADQDRYFRDLVFKFMRDDPLAFLGLQLRKVGLLLNRKEVRATFDPGFQRRLFRAGYLPLPGFGLIFALALPGLLALRIRDRKHQLLLIWGAVSALVVLSTVVASRYRVPFTAALAVLAGAGLMEIVRGLKKAREELKPDSGSRQRLVLRVALFVLGLGLTLIPLGPAYSDAEELTYLGLAWFKAGDAETARSYYDQALAEDPNHAMAMMLIARIYEKNNELDQAIVWNQKAAAADPDNSLAHYLLGMQYWHQGKHRESRDEFYLAVQCRPQWVEALFQLALREWRMGYDEQAHKLLHNILLLWPAHQEARELKTMIEHGVKAPPMTKAPAPTMPGPPPRPPAEEKAPLE